MFHIILYEPEIPPNTGNIIRLSVNSGFDLHLIKPLRFLLNDKNLKRAGMDYIKKTDFNVWERNISQFYFMTGDHILPFGDDTLARNRNETKKSCKYKSYHFKYEFLLLLALSRDDK